MFLGAEVKEQIETRSRKEKKKKKDYLLFDHENQSNEW